MTATFLIPDQIPAPRGTVDQPLADSQPESAAMILYSYITAGNFCSPRKHNCSINDWTSQQEGPRCQSKSDQGPFCECNLHVLPNSA